jgi:Mrp family chromosome partitioning ATPase
VAESDASAAATADTYGLGMPEKAGFLPYSRHFRGIINFLTTGSIMKASRPNTKTVSRPMNVNGSKHAPSGGNEMRDLVQRLNPLFANQQGCILTFIAARPGEGTTTVASHFAEALAKETGRKVLFLGTDPETERFTVQIADFSTNVENGGLLSNGAQQSQALQPSNFSNSLSKWTTLNDNRNLTSRLMHNGEFWDSMKDSFDVIVIDAPSLQSSSDGVVLASKSDSVILVVESESTRQPVIENLRDTLLACGANIAGVILNKRRFYIPDSVYKRL